MGRAFGFDEASLAALAAVIAVLALLVIGWAAREIAGPLAAPFAMLLAADSDILFWEFDQVRPYAFSVAYAALEEAPDAGSEICDVSLVVSCSPA